MSNHHPYPMRPPDPPDSANGWGRYVARSLEHLLVRLHYLEADHNDLKDDYRDLKDSHEKVREHTSRCSALSAPTSSAPAKAEWGEIAKQIGTAARWIAVCLVIGALALQRISISDLLKLGKLFANGG